MGVDLLDVGRHHTDAVMAMLEPLAYTVYCVEVTADDAHLNYPYLVVYPTPGAVNGVTLNASALNFVMQWQITAVGLTSIETQAAIDRSRMLFVGVTPVVPGRTCGLITQLPGTPPVRQDPTERDPVTGRPLFYGLTQFAFTSHPSVP